MFIKELNKIFLLFLLVIFIVSLGGLKFDFYSVLSWISYLSVIFITFSNCYSKSHWILILLFPVSLWHIYESFRISYNFMPDNHYISGGFFLVGLASLVNGLFSSYRVYMKIKSKLS